MSEFVAISRSYLNSVSKLDRHPILRIEDSTTLGEGKLFSKLDMNQAYQQLELDEVSKQYTVINTHKWLFRYRRLPFGWYHISFGHFLKSYGESTSEYSGSDCIYR